MTKVTLTVNGETRSAAVPPEMTLLRLLREEFSLTGSKLGCDVGDCGACTVIMDGKPVNACLVLGVEAEGSEVTTIEGLQHALQESFVTHGAAQCGFCTPGMIMMAKALLDENPHPTEAQVRFAIAGNICRCTGYTKIVEAILSVSNE